MDVHCQTTIPRKFEHDRAMLVVPEQDFLKCFIITTLHF